MIDEMYKIKHCLIHNKYDIFGDKHPINLRGHYSVLGP